MDLVVYTSLIGPGWTLHDPTVMKKGVEYIAFTDQPNLRSDRWSVRKVRTEGDPRIQSRQIKAMPHVLFPHADASLWLDSKFLLRVTPLAMAEHWLETWDMVALRHPDRDTIEDEAIAIAQLGKASREEMAAQIDAYRKGGYQKQRAITSTGVCLRRHSKVVNHFGELWWHEIRDRCCRDQMSVDYCAWRAGLKIGYLVGHYRENCYAQYIKDKQPK